MQLIVFTAGMAMASANSNMAESSAPEAQQLRGNNQVMKPTAMVQMYHGNSSHPQEKLYELWSMMHNATTSLDHQTIHTMERRFGPAMHSLQKSCDEDWNKLCSQEIEAEAHRVNAMKLSFLHTRVNMTQVVCLAKKYDQVSSQCKTTIALLNSTKRNLRSSHYQSLRRLNPVATLLFAPLLVPVAILNGLLAAVVLILMLPLGLVALPFVLVFDGIIAMARASRHAA